MDDSDEDESLLIELDESELIEELDWLLSELDDPLDSDDQLDSELSDEVLDALHWYSAKSSSTIAESELSDERDSDDDEE
jgi:hypothetical protein